MYACCIHGEFLTKPDFGGVAGERLAVLFLEMCVCVCDTGDRYNQLGCIKKNRTGMTRSSGFGVSIESRAKQTFYFVSRHMYVRAYLTQNIKRWR